MARRSRVGSPSALSLPLLRDDRGLSPDDGFGRPISRYDLEERLIHQERTTQQLLDKAYRTKEDLLDSLNYAHGTWKEEKANRELLQEHIKTITEVVRKLSRDIYQIEHQITAKSASTDSAAVAVKNLEVSHVAGVTDLRGRVGRCDAAIAKLAGDLKTCFDSVKSISQQQQEKNQQLFNKMSAYENKMNELTMKIDRMVTEQQLRLRHVEGDSTGKITSLDTKTRQLIEETRTTMNTFKLMEENEREKLETRLINHAERLNSSRDVRVEKIEKRMDESVLSLNRRVQSMEEDFIKDRDKANALKASLEAKVNTSLDAHLKRQTDEITRLKKECREGFATVHETISHMKQVMDGKRKLLEEQIRKEIAQIRKMVVLI